jgi:CRP-like cAMP-binding protein
LDALTRQDFDRIQPHLQEAPLPLKQVIHRAGDEIAHVYFPVAGMISVVAMLQDGSSVEVGTVGNEGLVGLSAFLGKGVSPHEVMVQGAGRALRASAAIARQEFNRGGAFRDLVLSFTELFLMQISQTAACNGRHGLEARCARWLLTMRDRLEHDSFPLTQEFLAMLLGVQRTGVTATAVDLQRRGLIRYSHGHVDILDLPGLEAASCECHRIIKDQFDGFLRS